MRNRAVQIPMLAILVLSLSGVAGCNPPPPRKGKIVGSSMSPTLRGAHYAIDCLGCGIQFSCDPEQADERANVICPNCGSATERDRWKMTVADPVSVLPDSKIRRWDIIAFERDRATGSTPNYELMTKRVVGLPGESIQFENGNLFANQVLISKPLEIQKQMRILVCDSKFQSAPSLNWPLTPETPWEFKNRQFQLRTPPNAGNFAWFDFNYQKNYFQTEVSKGSPALEDFYGYNQSLSRKLNRIDEVFVELNIRLNGGTLGWRFGNQTELYEFRINEALSEIQILVGAPNGTPKALLHRANISAALNDVQQRPIQIEFSSFDRVLRVAVNGTELWTHPLNPVGVPITQTMLSFGGNSDVAKIDRIRIWRDLYYFDADASKAPEKTAIAGFFVIGDNVPLSHDSRHWEQPGVAVESVKGKVIFH